jgi:hypothetical protein
MKQMLKLLYSAIYDLNTCRCKIMSSSNVRTDNVHCTSQIRDMITLLIFTVYDENYWASIMYIFFLDSWFRICTTTRSNYSIGGFCYVAQGWWEGGTGWARAPRPVRPRELVVSAFYTIYFYCIQVCTNSMYILAKQVKSISRGALKSSHRSCVFVIVATCRFCVTVYILFTQQIPVKAV